MRVLLTRPEPEAQRSADGLLGRGHEVTRLPLMSAEALGPKPLQGGIGGFILTSQRAAPYLPSTGTSLPVFATGARTADAARRQGFTRVFSADGDWQALADLIGKRVEPGITLAHFSGTRLRGDLASRLENQGIGYVRHPVYRMIDLTLPPDWLQVWLSREPPGAVLFYSPATAVLWQRLHVQSAKNTAICLSEACAEPLGTGKWARITVADKPNEMALWDCLETIG